MAINLGIIGLSASSTAWATRAHVTPLKSPALSPHYNITALATSSATSAKAAAEAHGIDPTKAYSSPEDIANDKDVDMVVVSVKVPLHRQLALPALHAKKDVFVEWPLAANTAQAIELAELAKKQGVRNIVGLQGLRAPVVQKVKEILSTGRLGRIVSTTFVVSTSIPSPYPAAHAYINDPTSGANLITIRATHNLSLLCYLLGEFASLNATTAINHPTVEILSPDGKETKAVPRTFTDSLVVGGVLRSGTSVGFTFNANAGGTPSYLSWVISGEKGSLKLEGGNPFVQMGRVPLYLYTPGFGQGSCGSGGESGAAGWMEVEVRDSQSFGGVGELYEAFAKGEGDGLVDFEGAVVRHRMIDAIVRSAERGTRETY